MNAAGESEEKGKERESVLAHIIVRLLTMP